MPLANDELAAVDRGLPRQHPQQRRLARAVAPGQRHPLPALEPEGDAAEERLPHHVLGEVGGDDDGHAIRLRRAIDLVPMRRALHTLLLTAFLFALSAPVALAHDGGEGLYGETNDKVVTNAGFIIIAAFPFLIFVLQHDHVGAGQAQGPPQEGRQGAHRSRGRAWRLVAASPVRALRRRRRPHHRPAGAAQRHRRRDRRALHDGFRAFVDDDGARVADRHRRGRRGVLRRRRPQGARDARRRRPRRPARLHPPRLAEADDRRRLRLVPGRRLRARAVVRPAGRHPERRASASPSGASACR